MKYNKNNPPMLVMMRNSSCFKETTTMEVKGVLWHSTAANNTSLGRYVQPDDDEPGKQGIISLLGPNKYRNDLNHRPYNIGMNAWIGKLSNGVVTSVQVMPWSYRPWGCGSGKNGSCNSGWIQFEICEDALTDKNYFEAVYKEACELTAYICKTFNIHPKGTAKNGNIDVPSILCHADAYKLGLGTNHSDIYHWFSRYGKDMEDVRNDVLKLIEDEEKPEPKPTPTPTPTPLSKDEIYRVRKSWNDRSSQIGAYKKLENAKATCDKNPGHNVYNSAGEKVYPVDDSNVVTTKTPFLVRVSIKDLYIRKGPGTNYPTKKFINPGAFTIVEVQSGPGSVKGWGKLKSGAGWISLDYVTEI